MSHIQWVNSQKKSKKTLIDLFSDRFGAISDFLDFFTGRRYPGRSRGSRGASDPLGPLGPVWWSAGIRAREPSGVPAVLGATPPRALTAAVSPWIAGSSPCSLTWERGRERETGAAAEAMIE